MLVLSKQDIQTALPMRDAIEAMKRAFKQLYLGKATVPARIHIDVPEHNGTTLFMAGYLNEDKNIAVKIVSVFADNPEKNLPVINAIVVIIDAETGIAQAILDGTYLTAIRTGAAAGAATDFLAREDASRAAIFGAGPQGRTQLEAMCAIRRSGRCGFSISVRRLPSRLPGRWPKKLRQPSRWHAILRRRSLMPT